MILLLDNYDSFTYNLFQYITELGEEVEVVRNDELDLQQLRSLKPNKLVISPGPSNPNNAGISNNAIMEFSDNMPLKLEFNLGEAGGKLAFYLATRIEDN